MSTKIRLLARRLATVCALLLAPGLPQALGQSVSGPEPFDPARVVAGIVISRPDCAALEAQHSAIWVTVEGEGACLRYYGAGLNTDGRGNPIAAGWLNGDVLGPRGNNADRRQSGFGPREVIAQQQALAAHYGVPFLYLGRPGTYGSAGKHYDLRGRPREAALVNAMLDALKTRYRIGAWALGGHSGGGTLVAEMLARRSDLRCAVISSGAAAYRAYLDARGLNRTGGLAERFDPLDSIGQIPRDATRRIFVIGDPRETNVPFSSQTRYFEAVRALGHAAWLLPLERANDTRHHDLMDFGEAATGLCAQAATTEAILARLRAMPEQQPRLTN